NQNGSGTPVNVASTTAISLSATGTGSLQFYSDPSCVNAIASATIGAGTSTASFYFKDPNVGPSTVTASNASIVAATQIENTTSPAPAETPWTTNMYGTLSTEVAYNWNMGYAFTPLYGGKVTRLCGYFDGTKRIRLYRQAGGAVLASATVTAANAWSCAAILPTQLLPNVGYSV